jgi:hypothetical protein
VSTLRTFHDDTHGRDAIVELFEFSHLIFDALFDCIGVIQIVESDLNGHLHKSLPFREVGSNELLMRSLS